MLTVSAVPSTAKNDCQCLIVLTLMFLCLHLLLCEWNSRVLWNNASIFYLVFTILLSLMQYPAIFFNIICHNYISVKPFNGVRFSSMEFKT
jgi:hypothetical protein